MKWLNGIMGVVVGDALGSPVQFHRRGEVTVDGMEACANFRTPPGAWTDDSSLTMATVESIQYCGKIDLENIASNFEKWLYNGMFTPFGFAYDIGATCMAAIHNYTTSKDVTTCGLRDEMSNGNGSLMRIMPACLAGTVEEVEKVSCMTHAHRRAQIACGLYWFMVKELCDGVGDLRQRLSTALTKGFTHYEGEEELKHYNRLRDLDVFGNLPESEISSSGYCVHTLEAAVWSLLQADSFRESLLTAVNLADDADSVGAVCGGLAGLYYEYGAIPAEWLEVIQRREWIEQEVSRVTLEN